MIISYMFDGIIGGFAMMLLLLVTSFREKEKTCIKWLRLMILSLPMSYIGILGTTMHQLLSWYNLFLVMFIISTIKYFGGKISISRNSALGVMGIFVFLQIGCIWLNDFAVTYIEIIQIFTMLLPIVIIHHTRYKMPISKEEIYELLKLYTNVCVSTAIGMIVQYLVYIVAGQQIGLMLFSGGGRVIYMGLFKGTSILPIFMGIGFITIFLELLYKKMVIQEVIKAVVIFLAMMLNSSRAALAMLFIIIAIIFVRKIIESPNIKMFFLGAIILVAGFFCVNYIMSLRSGLSSFLDANGRFETYSSGISIWLASLKNFLLGEGFSGGMWEGVAKPHNFLIQTLAQCGLLVTIIVLIFICSYLYINRKNLYVYLPLYVLLSSMLVTDFYANAFTTVIFIIVDIYGAKISIKEEMKIHN